MRTAQRGRVASSEMDAAAKLFSTPSLEQAMIECDRSLPRSPSSPPPTQRPTRPLVRSFLFLKRACFLASLAVGTALSMAGSTGGVEGPKEEERTGIVAFHQKQEGGRLGGHLKKLFNFAANCPPPRRHVTTRESSFPAAKKEWEKESRRRERRALWLYLFVGIRMGNGEK